MINRIAGLLYKLINNMEFSEAEQKELDIWLMKSTINRALLMEVSDEHELKKEVKELLKKESSSVWRKIKIISR